MMVQFTALLASLVEVFLPAAVIEVVIPTNLRRGSLQDDVNETTISAQTST